MKKMNRIIEKYRIKEYSEFDLSYKQTKKIIYSTIINVIKDEEIVKDLM